MSVMPQEPANTEQAQQLLTSTAAGTKPLTTSLGALTLSSLDYLAQLHSEREAAAARRRAAAQEQEERMRAQIRALSPADAEVLHRAVEAAAALLDAWHTGALDGVRDFRSTLIPPESKAAALALNLAWTVVGFKWQLLPLQLLYEFSENKLVKLVQAALPTLLGPPLGYDDLMGRVNTDLGRRLNDFRDGLLNQLDAVVLPLLQKSGFAAFAKLDRPQQLALLWAGLFNAPSQGNYIEPTRKMVKENLEKADRRAADHLKALERVWNASIRSAGVDLTGPRFVFDPRAWSSLTRDPAWLYTFGDVNAFTVFHTNPTGDPCYHRVERAVNLLQLAIDVDFKIGP